MRYKKDSWKNLLEACQKHGKSKVIETLEAYHKLLEVQSATLWAYPELHYKARKLDAILLKQDETLIRLKQMSDEDIKTSLATGKAGIHNA